MSRVLIQKCKKCPISPAQCTHAVTIRKVMREALPGLTFTHNCPIYPRLYKRGDRVKVCGELFAPEGTRLLTRKKGKYKVGILVDEPGTIVGYSTVAGKFRVKLDDTELAATIADHQLAYYRGHYGLPMYRYDDEGAECYEMAGDDGFPFYFEGKAISLI